MDMTRNLATAADDVLNDYLAGVNAMRDKTRRLAAEQREVCDTLRRTAEALRRLAENRSAR